MASEIETTTSAESPRHPPLVHHPERVCEGKGGMLMETRPFDRAEFEIPPEARGFRVFEFMDHVGLENTVYCTALCDDLPGLLLDLEQRQAVGLGIDTCAALCEPMPGMKSDGPHFDGWPLNRGGIDYLVERFGLRVYWNDEIALRVSEARR